MCERECICAREKESERVGEKSDSRKSGLLRQDDLYRRNFESSIDGAAERSGTSRDRNRPEPVAPPIDRNVHDSGFIFSALDGARASADIA